LEFSIMMKMNAKSEILGRTAGFTRNEALEALLHSLNSSLAVAEDQLISGYAVPEFPIVLLVGPLRSGTTLIMQWLASTGVVAYPTNLLSRFYGAPVLGAKIQLLLTDPKYNFRNELGELLQQIQYSSENGKTQGTLAPNEFWYFWRRFLPEASRDVWTDEELRAKFDSRTMLAELAGLTDVFKKPFAAKGLLFSYNIRFLNEILDKAIFVQTQRDPMFNIQSALHARERQLGTKQEWYSFKIPEYESLKALEPVAQVAAQVACINRAVASGMASLPEQRKMLVHYESFCANPRKTFDELADKLTAQGYPIGGEYAGPESFVSTDNLTLAPAEAALALRVYEDYLFGRNGA
jgi:hypothetical protein